MTDINSQLPALFTALVTPFDTSGRIDRDAFQAFLESQLESGVKGFVAMGTTGESATLDEEERDWVIESAVRLCQGTAKVFAGSGSNRTDTAIKWTKRATDLGVDGCLVVTPYYNKPSQEGLRRYFDAVAAATSLPIMLYSVPSRCGVEIAPETAAILANDHLNIIAIKDAGGSIERITDIRKACGEPFLIYSGDDALTWPSLAVGAVGVVSVVSNLMPALMISLLDCWSRREIQAGIRLHERIASLSKGLFVESNPVPVKTALALLGVMSDFVRPPLAPLSEKSQTILKAAIEAA